MSDIAKDLGYSSNWSLLYERLSETELMDLLANYVDDDVQGWAYDMVKLIAKEEFNYTPKED